MDHFTLRTTEAEQAALAALAARLGYVQNIRGVEVPNVSALIRAIANGELVIVPAGQPVEQSQEVKA